MIDEKTDMTKKVMMQYVLIEELKKAINEYHDSLCTVFYSPEDFAEEQIQYITKDLPIGNMYSDATISQGQMIIIPNKYFNSSRGE